MGRFETMRAQSSGGSFNGGAAVSASLAKNSAKTRLPAMARRMLNTTFEIASTFNMDPLSAAESALGGELRVRKKELSRLCIPNTRAYSICRSLRALEIAAATRVTRMQSGSMKCELIAYSPKPFMQKKLIPGHKGL